MGAMRSTPTSSHHLLHPGALLLVHPGKFAVDGAEVGRRRGAIDEVRELADVHIDVAMGPGQGRIDFRHCHPRPAGIHPLVPLMGSEADVTLRIRRRDIHEGDVDGLVLGGPLIVRLEAARQQIGEICPTPRIMRRAAEVADENFKLDAKNRAEVAAEPSRIDQRRR